MKSIYTGILIVFTIGTLLLTSCSKEVTSSTVVDNAGVFSVDVDSSVDFSKYQTIAVNDSVVFTNGKAYSKELNDLDMAYVNAWKDSLAELGFTVVDKKQNPDLILNITKVDNSINNIFNYSTFWKYYAVLYKPSAYGATGAQYVSSFDNSQASKDLLLSFEIIDLKNKTTSKLPVIWNGVVTDKTISTDIDDLSFVMDGLLYLSPELKNQ